MADTKDNGLSPRIAFVVAVVSAGLGGLGGPFVLQRAGVDTFRPDPFTGSDGQILEARINRLEDHVAQHPDATGRFDSRLTALETRQELILNNQLRILDRLERQ